MATSIPPQSARRKPASRLQSQVRQTMGRRSEREGSRTTPDEDGRRGFGRVAGFGAGPRRRRSFSTRGGGEGDVNSALRRRA